jgi:hypothetical protein
MILTEAKKRAQREFDGALEVTGLTVEEVRVYVEARPAMRAATYPIPRKGLAAGTAANLVLHVAELMGRGSRLAALSGDRGADGSRSEATVGVAS